VIQIQNIKKEFGEQVIFNDASLLIASQERVGLVGRNGSGKSTLFKILLNEEHLDGGSIQIPKNYTLGHLSQHLYFEKQTVYEEACSILKPNEDGWLDTHSVEAILFGLGFNQESLKMSPSLLSGGFQIRLNLAKVLAAEPNILLLDEPTNYLDIVSTRWLSRFLRSWKGELLLITHDKKFMDSVCTHTAAIYQNKFRKIQGPVNKLLETIEAEEEVLLRTAENDSKKREQLERVIERFRFKASKAAMVQSKIKAVERLSHTEIQTNSSVLDFSFTEAPFPGKRLCKISDLGFAYKDKDFLLQNLSFEIFKGDRIAVIGPNGRGKTTFLNLLANELSPTLGEISFNPNVQTNYFGQTNINRLHLNNTVEEEIQSALKDTSRGKARSLAGLMMFSGDAAMKRIQVLSGGERSRVLLAKILATECNFLLLDEPTNHLDMDSIESLLEALENFEGTSVVVTHDEALLHAFAKRLIVFDGGECFVFEGTYKEFLENVGWKEEKEISGFAIEQKSIQKPKEDRKARADYIAMRSKLLKPLEQKIKKLEEEIQFFENQTSELESLLVEISAGSDGEKISETAKKLDNAKEKIESLFVEWETASTELETLKEKYPL
jgi:ATP-binding cassette subfamily F protein 3